jgi:aminoglycoside phosphotransferase
LAVLAAALKELLPHWPRSGELSLEPLLSSSRPVFRFISGEKGTSAVGKFFHAFPPQAPADRGLAQEYNNYLWAAYLGLAGNHGSRRIPRLLGRRPEIRLGLLLEDIPGWDLDHLVAQAGDEEKADLLYRGLENLAELLAFFHNRPLPSSPAAPQAALGYLDKLRGQLQEMGLLTPEDDEALEEEGLAWELHLHGFPDRQVLAHGDVTPTNLLFPAGVAVALDLERLGGADRLWDLSWVAGELKHTWTWRHAAPEQAEPYIRHFFSAYLYAMGAPRALADRVYRLNPFFMALVELRIARNLYLTWDYRRGLVHEARRCLYFGRRM